LPGHIGVLWSAKHRATCSCNCLFFDANLLAKHLQTPAQDSASGWQQGSEKICWCFIATGDSMLWIKRRTFENEAAWMKPIESCMCEW
jgi:hypothetical protein